MAKSVSHTREVKGYLKPSPHKFITDYVRQHEITTSQAINEAVRALQEKTNPPKQKHDY